MRILEMKIDRLLPACVSEVGEVEAGARLMAFCAMASGTQNLGCRITALHEKLSFPWGWLFKVP